MSATVIASLLATNQKIILYCGIPILIIGLFGGFINTIVFLSLKTFRENSCAFYLTVLSIVNIGQLVAGLLTRIMISGFCIDWTQTSLFLCKFRTFASQTTAMISFTCISLATIDQYFATCSRPRWQQWSNIKIACRTVIVSILIAIIIQSPCLIFYDHIKSSATNTSICTIISGSFVQFNTYFNYLIVGNILPYIITFSFGYMAYSNTQHIAYRTVPLVRRELDKQLTVMVLVHVLYTCFSIFPNTIMYLILSYGNIQDSFIIAQLRLTYALTTCLYYSYFAVSVSLFRMRFMLSLYIFFI
jgi:hypothetical protein